MASGVARWPSGAPHELYCLCDPGQHAAQWAYILYYQVRFVSRVRFMIWLCADDQQRRSLVSLCMPCRIVRQRHTRCPSQDRLMVRPPIMRQIYQTRFRLPCLRTSPISPQACRPSPAVETTTRPCKRVQIASRHTAAGFVLSHYPVVANFRRNSNQRNHHNNRSSSSRHSYNSRRARHRATPRWATPRGIPRCCRVSRRATLRTARVPSFWAFAVLTGRRRSRSRAMASDLSITRMATYTVGACLALRRIGGGTYIATGTEASVV